MPDAAADRSERERWPVEVRSLDDHQPEDLSDTTTAEERIAMVWELSQRMWELTGRPWPEYERSEMPIRIIRRR